MKYMGIDCGSVSMKAVVIDEKNNIQSSYYTKNQGIDTLKEVLKNIRLKDRINGVGITGSGRDLISHIIGGITESEIISHYTATNFLHPEARTIFDIGGEDCKLICINNGVLTHFSMNYECGGGTGAMIESIAYRMNIPLEEIGETALKSKNKIMIASKCGIFAQSAVVSKLNRGISKEDILMGVCRGLVGNYFTMLAKGIRLEPPYVFQGATAKNKALVKCFEEELRDNVIIPKYPDLMGAYGIAILSKNTKTNFRDFDIIDYNFNIESYIGNCINQCEISRIYENNKYIGAIGNKCERCVKNDKI